ncbi:uracil-DNA glycosylase [Metabacillus indicus]|uniref:uracil-DNA glycosylase n=1 Tax=Metabacillus indicus TaxID=246786 RepID=UPI000493803E|nr:uracil-DNA glycosylase [Metabacillus indicus]KEZ49335.1 uracil-DNA glycosylase [Metabacillus indicus LMG 22858]
MKQLLHDGWWQWLKPEFEKSYYAKLREFLKEEYASETVYPPMNDIFHALDATSYENVKAVILGQDPYHGPNQAHGLSFSVQKGVKQPPSLRNIFLELKDDLGCEPPDHGCLEKWADQGVLLLNTVLTVRKGQAASHKGQGWETFTDRIIELLNEREQPVVFILWGKHAAAKKELIDENRHVIIESPHPSPFSARRGFFGSKPFSKTNEALRKLGRDEIDWEIE